MSQSEIRKKELDRIRKWISRAESRGYYIEDEVRLHYKEFSTQKLKALTPQKLYEKSWLITEDEALPGLKGRFIERQETGKKISETQKANRESAREFYSGSDELKKVAEELTVDVPRFVPPSTPLTEEDEDIIKYYKATASGLEEVSEDEANNAHYMVDPDTGEFIAMGDVILSTLNSLIDEFSTTGKEYLHNLLNSEINRYGPDAVVQAINQMPPEVITGIQQVLYYLGKNAEDIENVSNYISPSETHRRLKEFADLILASVPSKDSAKEVGRILDTL